MSTFQLVTDWLEPDGERRQTILDFETFEQADHHIKLVTAQGMVSFRTLPSDPAGMVLRCINVPLSRVLAWTIWEMFDEPATGETIRLDRGQI